MMPSRDSRHSTWGYRITTAYVVVVLILVLLILLSMGCPC